MKIAIAKKIKAFSHTPGFTAFVPGTTCALTFYPIKITCDRPSFTYTFPHSGPVIDFTVEVDLEKKRLVFHGKGSKGFFSYFIFERDGAVYLFCDRGQDKGKEVKLCPSNEQNVLKHSEKLSLGSHKKQEWETTAGRGDLFEILPLWHYVGSLTPCQETAPTTREGNYTLLSALKHLSKKEGVEEALLHLFQAAFSSFFIPKVNDDHYLGLSKETKKELPALPLLSEGAAFIRSLFFLEEKQEIFLLPQLPISFHAGRYENATTASGDLISFEWSKKTIKKATIEPSLSRKVTLKASKASTCRVRSSKKERGIRWNLKDPLSFEKGKTLYLDRFSS